VNQVKLSGLLASEVTVRPVGRDSQMAVASLQFSKTSKDVFLLAIGERVRQLSEFRRGDAVAITGRLTVDQTTNQFVILIDVAGPWAIAKDRAGFEFDPTRTDRTMHDFFKAARVRGR